MTGIKKEAVQLIEKLPDNKVVHHKESLKEKMLCAGNQNLI